MNQKPVICRFCRTDLRLKYFPKAPTCNVSAKLENKDLLNFYQNKDVIYVVIADCLIDLGKPLDIKARESKMRVLAQTTTFRPLLWRANAVDEN